MDPAHCLEGAGALSVARFVKKVNQSLKRVNSDAAYAFSVRRDDVFVLGPDESIGTIGTILKPAPEEVRIKVTPGDVAAAGTTAGEPLDFDAMSFMGKGHDVYEWLRHNHKHPSLMVHHQDGEILAFTVDTGIPPLSLRFNEFQVERSVSECNPVMWNAHRASLESEPVWSSVVSTENLSPKSMSTPDEEAGKVGIYVSAQQIKPAKSAVLKAYHAGDGRLVLTAELDLRKESNMEVTRYFSLIKPMEGGVDDE